jgi:alpha-amylase
MNDNFVDWYGIEAGQSIEAESTALDWTTDIWPAAYVSLKTIENDGYGQEPLNTWARTT